MKFRPGRNMLALFAVASIVVSSCGLGANAHRIQRTSSPADQVDPFQYGDEFPTSATKPSEETPPPSPSDTLNTGSRTISSERIPASPQPVGSERSRPSPAAGALYQIQLSGVFDNKEEADNFANKVRKKLNTPVTVEYRAPFYRVFTGSFATQSEAEASVAVLKQKGFPDSRWILINTATP